jgi:lysyl-tRNA synthetase, class II
MSDYSLESLDRIEKIRKLKEAWVIVYANNYHGKQDILEVSKNTSNLKDVETLQENWAENVYKTAWRLMSYKSHWKLAFAKIMDHTWTIQICFMKDKFKFNTWREIVDSLVIEWEEKSSYKISEKFINVWDYIWIVWDLFLTKHWELTIFVSEFQILSKAIRPLPEKFHWIKDEETIYRQRYLDLITNDESYNRFVLRSKFIKTLRDFYHENDFVEIETPVLWNAASGAAAAPFITHHNDFNEEYFLRISPETFLKRATVWRFERVVEFTRNFRNEGSDPSHMQEFSAIEHYACWWNFEDNMRFTERMFDFIFKNIPEIKKEIMIQDKNWNEKLVNFSTPWQRIDYVEGVKEACWIDVSKYFIGDEKKLISDIKAAWVEFEWMDNMVVPTLIDYLYKKVLRPWIVWPAFVYNYPKTMQPLARQSDENSWIVEQFQLVVNGWEILKAYWELVDPEIQKSNFDAQSKAKEMWDEEATSWDDDFVYAMEYWMPPQSWWWMWIERIFSMLTNQTNLRDVVLFPLMKSEKNNAENKKIKETKIAVAIINKSSWMELWQELNTVSHLSSSFAWRIWKELFLQDTVSTSDWNEIKLNIQHAIMIKKSNNQNDILESIKKARELWLEISEFTREMIITSDDKKVKEITANKKYEDIEYLWVLFFGNKKAVDSLTKDFELYS